MKLDFVYRPGRGLVGAVVAGKPSSAKKSEVTVPVTARYQPVTHSIEFPVANPFGAMPKIETGAVVLYRHFAADGSLLYVGITRTPGDRIVGHKTKSPWFGLIRRVDVAVYPDRVAAEAAEVAAISREKPRYNQQPGVFRGDHGQCPVCGHRPKLAPAEKQRAYRARKKVAP